jgi:UDP-N-acetylglucosamine 2-epimerase (non-hydrolysing)
LNICSALKCIATKYPDVDLIYPVHLNPNVQAPVKSMLKGMKNIQLIAPLDYEPFIYLMSRSYIILTDSGGIQEEAPSLRKPVLVMRETTERPEGVEAGTAKLVGVKAGSIMEHTMRLLDDEAAYAAMSCKVNPYGDGKASEKIAAILSDTGLERHGQEAA